MGEKTTLTVPRCYNTGQGDKIMLVGFCDASERAYAAAVYLRMGEEESRVQLVAAKTRVSPTKSQTIPRLELMSALLLARLCHTVEEALKGVIQLDQTVCYTDSKVALHWIRGMDKEWKQFVQNRVDDIRCLIPADHWNHCPGESNPADIPSRGMLPRDLEKSRVWLEGPEWLKKSLDPVEEKTEEIPQECLKEERTRSHTLTTIQRKERGLSVLIDPEEFNTWQRLLRTTAQVLKFTHLVRGEQKSSSELLREARTLWLRENQQDLQSDRSFNTWREQLNLQKDEEGLWRCVGRMEQSDLDADAKKPILIERSHHCSSQKLT